MRFNAPGCLLLIVWAVMQTFITLPLGYFVGRFAAFLIGASVATTTVFLIDLGMRLGTRTEEEKASSSAGFLIDPRRGGFLGCLPMWMAAFVLPFLLYSQFVTPEVPAPAPAAAQSTAPAAAQSTAPARPPDSRFLLDKSATGLKKKEYNTVVSCSELALKDPTLTAPDRIRALAFLGEAREGLGQFDMAVRIYEELIGLDPQSRVFYERLQHCRVMVQNTPRKK